MKKEIIIKGAICLFAVVAFIIYCVWEDNAISISHYIYKSQKISDDLNGYKIVQISDLQNKSFGDKSVHLLDKIAEEAPDIIVVTGDLADRNHTDIPAALDFMEGAVKIAPVYYVTGNHEHGLSEENFNILMDGMKNFGVIILENKCVSIAEGDSSFNLIGLFDNHLTDDSLSGITPQTDNFNILLAHEPQFIEKYAAENIDLVFSGHAHGGQFRIPFIGGVYAPGQGLWPKYTEGMHTVNDTTMVISRGLGNSLFPIRINNRPEIVVLELRAE